MGENTLTVDIVTPAKAEYSDNQVTLVSAPAALGRIGILPGHMPLVSTLEKGELTIKEKSGREVRMDVSPGFIQVKENQIIVLVEKVVI